MASLWAFESQVPCHCIGISVFDWWLIVYPFKLMRWKKPSIGYSRGFIAIPHLASLTHGFSRFSLHECCSTCRNGHESMLLLLSGPFGGWPESGRGESMPLGTREINKTEIVHLVDSSLKVNRYRIFVLFITCFALASTFMQEVSAQDASKILPHQNLHTRTSSSQFNFTWWWGRKNSGQGTRWKRNRPFRWGGWKTWFVPSGATRESHAY